MATYISIHEAKTIRASTVQDHNDCSPHITLEFDGDNYETRARVTVYLPDAELNQRLIDLINKATGVIPIPVEPEFDPNYPEYSSNDDEPSF